MTAIADHADHAERDKARTPMLFGRFRTWLAMVAFVTILAGCCSATTRASSPARWAA